MLPIIRYLTDQENTHQDVCLGNKKRKQVIFQSKGQLFQPKWIIKKRSSTVSRLYLISAVNFFGTKIPTPPPFQAPVFSDLYFPKKVCDAVKKLYSIVQSVSNQVSVTAKKVLMRAVCKKFANSSNLFFKL